MQESSEVSMKIPFFERRRRIRRPWTLLFFGIAFLLLPFLNYLGITSQLQISPQMPVVALKLLNPVELILLFTPILVGIGLLAVKRWGWWLFLAYAVVLIVHNIYALARSPGYYNAGALIQTILGVAAVLYFVRRDISAPYMRMYPRGWRIQKRKPVEVEVLVDGVYVLEAHSRLFIKRVRQRIVVSPAIRHLNRNLAAQQPSVVQSTEQTGEASAD